MMRMLAAGAAAFACLTVPAAMAAPVTIDFEVVPEGSQVAASTGGLLLEQNGYRITASGTSGGRLYDGGNYPRDTDYAAVFYNRPNAPGLPTTDYGFTVSRTDGSAFDFLSLDANAFGLATSNLYDLTINYELADGSTGRQRLRWNGTFGTLAVNLSGIVRATLSTGVTCSPDFSVCGGTDIAVDNLVLEASAVPLPGAVLFFLTGAAGLVARRVRRA